MGEVWVKIEISANPEGPWEKLDVLADTGATLPFIPVPLLRKLGIRPAKEVTVGLADGSQAVRNVGYAFVRWDGDEAPCSVIFAEPSDAPLLGLTALEQLGLGVDTVNRRLIKVGFRAF